MGFRGIPIDAFDFYARLSADNSRSFWQANKPVFDTAVKAPITDLLGELADFGPFHVFRPHRDVRFSKDKTPYKDHIGAYGESQGGAGFYVQVGADGMVIGSGYYEMASDQLQRFRVAVDAHHTGTDIAHICDRLSADGFTLTAISELKTAPRGFAKDHPRIELLRRKGLVMTRQWPVAKWMHTAAAATRIRAAWDAAAELNAWLDTHVGPSTLAPDDDPTRFGPVRGS